MHYESKSAVKYPNVSSSVQFGCLSVSVKDEGSHDVVWKIGHLSSKDELPFVSDFLFQPDGDTLEYEQQDKTNVDNFNSKLVMFRPSEVDNKVHDNLTY